ncbi:BTAD domain-containing putative transcriptional regulator [Actinoplanes sp. NPDC049265]|uniref:AfsR/SARP family transcriptional regulator n=1 Tax=Actinoplanes sp. NPDC049265 TaxID=3363902 RepID=UPI003721EEEA
MRFHLLGSLRVTRGDIDIALGPRQQRLVLALLLARAGALVTMTELIDLLWEESAPASASNVVHRQIGALRRLLEPGLATRETGRYLTRQMSGYQLHVDTDSLDLLEFRRLCARARATDDADTRLDLLLAGLRLWRGRAAAGLEPISRTHPAFTSIEAEHALAVRDAADAAERCGRATAVLAPLRDAAARHPLDEALQSRLLVALAADGRQAEAVDLYHAVRRRMADELGIDPGEEMRDAYDRVVRRSGPRTPSGTSSATPLPAPAQLPPDLPFFAGRAGPLAEAYRVAGAAGPDGAGVLAIDGMPGVGKTTLAVHIAHALAPRYPDGQLYVELRGFDGQGPAMSTAEALRGLLGSLGVPQDTIPTELHAQAGLFRSTVAGRRLLIVLDNCRDTEQVRHLLPGTPGGLVIVTSRSRLTGLMAGVGAHPMPVGLPTVEEAREGFIRRLGPARVNAAPAAVDEIIESCGRLPLACAVVCARAAGRPDTPLDRIAAELTQARGSLDGFSGDDPNTDLRAVFSWSYRALTPDTARLFRLLPAHPGKDVSIAGAAALAGVPARVGRQLVGELNRAHLTVEHRPGRYQTHDLLRAYATELLDDAGADERAAAEDRCLRFYRSTAAVAHQLFATSAQQHDVPDVGPDVTPLTFPDRVAAMSWLEAEAQVLIDLVQFAARTGRHTAAWQLAIGIQHYFERSGRSLDWVATARVALEAAERGGDLAGQARTHRSLAGGYYFQRDFDAAVYHLERSRSLYVALGLGPELSRVDFNIAMVLRQRGRHEEALAALEGPIRQATATGDQKQLADAAVEQAANHAALGHREIAMRLVGPSLAYFREIGDQFGAGECWDVIGKVRTAAGEHDAAVAAWRAAAGCYREASAGPQTAEALTALGDALTAAGDVAGAARAWDEALSLISFAQAATAHTLRRRLRPSA